MKHRSILRVIGCLVGVGGVAFCLTLVSRGMRSVQQIGGYCASGGPYQIAHQCPSGVTGVLPLAIIGGLVFLGIFGVCGTDNERSMLLLAWPALFLSLGWNFLDYGFGITNGGGVNGGFLTCGIIFIVMGAVPLIWLLPKLWRIITKGQDPSDAPTLTRWWGDSTSAAFTPSPSSSPTPQWGAGVQSTPPATTTTTTVPTTTTTTPRTGKDLAGELEKLASLHRRGELSDAEYEAAKSKAIGGNPT